MRYVELPPPPPLRPFVRCMWLLEDPTGGATETERVLPDGCIEVIVHYGNPMRRVDGGSRDAAQRSAFVGQIRSALELVSCGPIGMVAARFHPWAATPFLGDLATQFTERSISLEDVWGARAHALEERIAEAASDTERLTALSDALVSRLRPGDELERALQHAVTQIAQRRGSVSIEDLASELGWSRRRLERRFAASVGLTPKSLCRIERFQYVVQALSEPAKAPRLIDLALDAGYADQSHLARDFRDLAGLSVTSYLAEQHELSDLLTDSRPRESGVRSQA